MISIELNGDKMIPNFKVGDLVQYDISLEFEFEALDPNAPAEQYMRLGIITGFYDNETGEKLSGDFTTHDKVVEASIAGSNGTERIFITELELISPIQCSQTQ